jgi:predicted transcriptional regulator
MTQDTLDIEAFQKVGLSFKEIESVKRGLDDINHGRVVSYEQLKRQVKKDMLSHDSTIYA